MKLLASVALLLIALFYVAWPAASAYQLKVALESGDVAGVERGIDFPAVRQSLRPAVTERMQEGLKGLAKGTPGGDLLAEKMGGEMLPKLVDGTLETVLTPQAVIRLHAEGRSLKDFIATMKSEKPGLADQVGGLVRDLFGKATPPATPSAADAPAAAAPIVPESKRLGLGNIKSIGLDGPFAIALGLARDPKAAAPDLTATLSFEGTGWRVTGLVPRLGAD